MYKRLDSSTSPENVTFTDGTRYLSGSEAYLHELTQHEEHFMLFVNVDTFVSTMALNENVVRKALIILSRMHKLLQSKITYDENGDCYFEPIDLEENDDWLQLKYISVDNVYDWTSIVNEELKVNFNHDGPLWRAVFLSPQTLLNNLTYTLIFVCDHCILDGRGAFDLISNQLLPILNCLIKEDSLEGLPKPTTLLKSFTDIFFNMQGPISTQPSNITRSIVNVLLWQQKKFGVDVSRRQPEIRVYEEYQKDEGHYIYPFHINEELTSSVIHFSKEKSITVNTLLLVLISSALRETTTYFPLCKKTIKTFMYSTDMRKFNNHLSTSPLSCGSYVDVERQQVSPVDVSNEKEFLKVATKVNNDVRKRIKPPNFSKKMLYMGMIPFVRNKELGIQEKLINATNLDELIALSNIGNCDVMQIEQESSPSHPIKLLEHYFTVCSPSPILISTCTYRKQMRFCLCYDGHWLSEHFVETFVDNLKEMMQTVAMATV